MKKNFRCKSCNIFNMEAECEHLSKCYKFLNTTIDNIHNLHCEIFTYLSSQPEVIKVSKPNPNCCRSWRGKLADGRSVYLLMSFCILQKGKSNLQARIWTKRELLYTAPGNLNLYSHCRKQHRVPQNLPIPLLGIYSRKIKSVCQADI